MAIGQKMGSMKALKKSLAKGSGAGFVKYIPKNGTLNVRFLEEPESWVNYAEHYDQMLRKSYPCNGEDSCPGCKTDERRSSRYLANAVDLETKKVIPLQLPKDLANRLVVRYEKKGTLTDCDIELSRTGEGLDTVYDYDAEAPSPRKMTAYQTLDLLGVLDAAWDEVFGEQDDDEDDDPKPVKKAAVKPRKQSAAAKVAKGATLDDDEDEDDDEDDEPVAPKKAAGKKSKKAEPVFEEDDDEDDDSDDDEDAPDEDDEDDFYDEDTLKAMSIGELRAVARDFGIDTKGMKAKAIIEAILDEGDQEEDDD